MNDPHQDKDGRLSQALQAWKVRPPLPPRFQQHVWERIARAEDVQIAAVWTVFQSWLRAALSRRAVAVSYLAILLATGMTAGYLKAQEKSRQVETGLSERYLKMVDPYQTSSGNK